MASNDDSIANGLISTRMTFTPDELEQKRQRAARARKNLAAFALEQHPDDTQAAAQWFGDLADMLGIRSVA